MNITRTNLLTPITAIILAIAIILSGKQINDGLKNFRNYENSVSVKGLAVKDVEANLAVWPISHTATGDEIAQVQKTISENGDKIILFLKQNGVKDSDIVGRSLNVNDLMTNAYSRSSAYDSRYIVTETITVRTEDINALEKAYKKSSNLLQQNVVLGNSNGTPEGQNIAYHYTQLNDQKPAMIAEATQNARDAAKQFAKDSGAHVGKLKSASQGYFQILPRDSDESYQEKQSRYKTLRVVTTMEYYLED